MERNDFRRGAWLDIWKGAGTGTFGLYLADSHFCPPRLELNHIGWLAGRHFGDGAACRFANVLVDLQIADTLQPTTGNVTLGGIFRESEAHRAIAMDQRRAHIGVRVLAVVSHGCRVQEFKIRLCEN
ncbi:MAG: hypothetical protein ACK5JT_08650 [Hyphomicrobiaceae bacterium]